MILQNFRLNHIQVLIHPVILLVEGEVHQFEAVGEFEHGVGGDCAAALAMETGGVYVHSSRALQSTPRARCKLLLS